MAELITDEQLAGLFNEIDPEMKMTEYRIRKARLSGDEKEFLSNLITETLEGLAELPENIAATIKACAKRAEENPVLWPSLIGRI